MNCERAIAYREVHDKCGMGVLRVLTPQMSDETRAVMLEFAEKGGVVEKFHEGLGAWKEISNPDFLARHIYRLRPELPRMAFVEGPGGGYEYPEPLKELGGLDGVWIADWYSVRQSFTQGEIAEALRHRAAHATREAAEAHRRAEILARRGEV